MSGRAYLDWNATAPLRPEARAAMAVACDLVGNPSSVHAEGRAAKMAMERARDEVAEALGARAEEVVFTSGATEGASVLAQFADVTVDPTAHDALQAHARGAGGLLAVGLANGETGIVTDPLPDAPGGLFVDAVQAVGRLPFAFGWSGAAFAIASGHKLGGPKGAGVLLVKDARHIAPLLPGGGQEKGRRSGTENLIGILGMAAAMKAALADLAAGLWDQVADRRDRMEARLLDAVPGAIVVGRDRPRLPNTTCLLRPGWKGETQVMQMDLAGFAVSAGSACSSGKVRASRVLKAMGHSEADAASAIRISTGPSVTEAQLTQFTDAWIAAEARIRARAA